MPQPTNQLTAKLTDLDLGKFTLLVDTTHHYRPRWSGFAAQCRVRLWHNNQGAHIVMFTELQANKGISFTNYSENLATQIRQLFGLDVDTTYWIEHYPATAERKRIWSKELDQVTYEWDLRTYTADAPEWHRLDPAAVQPLFAEPGAPSGPGQVTAVAAPKGPPVEAKPTAQDWNRAQWIKLKREKPTIADWLYKQVMRAAPKESVIQDCQLTQLDHWLQKQIECAYDHLVTVITQDLPPI